MNPLLRTLALFLLLTRSICHGDPPPATPAPAPAGSIALNYHNDGTQEIEVKGGTFRYVWYTAKKMGTGFVPQDLSALDRHEFTAPLAAAQLESFRQWANQHHIYAPPRDLPNHPDRSHGLAELTVEDGRDSYAGKWTHPTPELAAAITDLKTLAKSLVPQENGAAPAAPPAPAADAQSVIKVFYWHASLQEIEFNGSTFRHMWRTQKNDGSLGDRQSLDAFDRYEFTTTPSPTELATLRAWLQRHRQLFGSPQEFPVRERNAYASAFASRLVLQDGAQTYEAKWDGSSAVPKEVTAAVEEFQALAKQFTPINTGR